MESLSGSRRSVKQNEINELRDSSSKAIRDPTHPPRFFHSAAIIASFTITLCIDQEMYVKQYVVLSKKILWTLVIATYTVSSITNPFISSFVTKRSLLDDNYQ